MKKAIFRVLALTVACSTSALAQQLVSVFGSTQVGGRDTIVHIRLVIPPGANANAIAAAALREQGARPFQADEFSTTGLVWDQFSDANPGNDFVTQYYNPNNQPTGAEPALQNTHAVWTNVDSSTFTFFYGGQTNRCPSLVRECPGPQVYDGFNDIAWLALSGCCTLGVTWFGTSIDEADMALNTSFPWNTNGSDYDIETVYLHENGHVLGLGHSDVLEAVMYAYYAGLRHALHADDIDGVSFLYPSNPAACGDGSCDAGEDQCTCAVDCGDPPLSEDGLCTDGLDNDCDATIDCFDADCTTDAACTVNECTLGQTGDFCTTDGDCCSNKCRGRAGAKTCKE